MRFDHLGVGDSGGDYQGFEHLAADIQSACETFLAQDSRIKELVLWGECDAAAAVMMTAWRDPRITGMIIQNPWFHADETTARATLKNYYRNRIRQKSFWLKSQLAYSD